MSTWKQGAAKRRDARQVKSSDEPKKAVSGTSGKPSATKVKDTRKWCKGKLGVEHQLECRKYDDIKNSFRGHAIANLSQMTKDWYVLFCTKCGKEIDHWYPFSSRTKNPKPEWVK